MTSRIRRLALTILKHRAFQLGAQASLAALLLWIWARSLDWGHIASLLQPRSAGWLLAVAALAPAGALLRALRWKLLVGRTHRLGLMRALWINEGANLVNIVVPARIGDLLRMFWLRRWCRIPTGGGAGLVMADHAFDMGVAGLMLGVTAVAYVSRAGLGPAGIGMVADAGAALIMFGLLVFGVLFMPGLVRSRFARRHLPVRMGTWLREQSAQFDRSGLHGLGRARSTGATLATLGSYCTDALLMWALFGTLGMGLGIPQSLAASLALVPGYAVPAPGGAGVVELVGTFAVQAGGGLQHAAAAAGVLAFHAAGLTVSIALGLVAIALLGLPARRTVPVRA